MFTAPRVEKIEAVNVLAHEDDNIDSPTKRQALSVLSKEPPLLLVLPAGRVRSNEVQRSEPEVEQSKDEACLLDTLIADLVRCGRSKGIL